ncbi:DUF4129 domain-containing protein [Rufibacter glacialis]|uniref:DUF4129 domain-containing protein n=1 Tax=Rufibacter glacialis TaxID=1259555 RepID=A0A5M8Q5V2_9BACT|nr:DUF4129 domain-containing protein [Rufibacter glacialis]KAA6430180.1 DUF4129 domain-containing protein [Rufibacter glacialis]GGK87084.1 hypothetical protein GCM10011405_38540 [Rufibacter glacialis]
MRSTILIFLLLFWGSFLAFATGAVVPVPSSAAPPRLEVRHPNPQRLQALREKREFQYQQDVRPDRSLWERFWRRIGKFLSNLLAGTSYQGFWKYVVYAIAIGTTVFVVLKLLQVDFTGLLGRKAAPAALAYETYRENIHEIDFQTLLEEAEAQGDYRRAVRLHYLRTLKALTDQGLIDWRPGKTNRSYVSEIPQGPYRKPFERLTQSFEYVWYGGAGVDQPTFEAVRRLFHDFNGSLPKAA